jgi:hypothetical protein
MKSKISEAQLSWLSEHVTSLSIASSFVVTMLYLLILSEVIPVYNACDPGSVEMGILLLPGFIVPFSFLCFMLLGPVAYFKDSKVLINISLALFGLVVGCILGVVALRTTQNKVYGLYAQYTQTDLPKAVLEFEQKEKRLPDTLDELVPKYISQLPTPPELCNDVRYKKNEFEWALYMECYMKPEFKAPSSCLKGREYTLTYRNASWVWNDVDLASHYGHMNKANDDCAPF